MDESNPKRRRWIAFRNSRFPNVTQKGILQRKCHISKHDTLLTIICWNSFFIETVPSTKHFTQYCQDCAKIAPSAAVSKFVHGSTANTDQILAPQCNGLNVHCLTKLHCIVLCALLSLPVSRKPFSFLLSRDNE